MKTISSRKYLARGGSEALTGLGSLHVNVFVDNWVCKRNVLWCLKKRCWGRQLWWSLPYVSTLWGERKSSEIKKCRYLACKRHLVPVSTARHTVAGFVGKAWDHLGSHFIEHVNTSDKDYKVTAPLRIQLNQEKKEPKPVDLSGWSGTTHTCVHTQPAEQTPSVVIVCCFCFWAMAALRRKETRWSKFFNLRALQEKRHASWEHMLLFNEVHFWWWCFAVSMACWVVLKWAVQAVTWRCYTSVLQLRNKGTRKEKGKSLQLFSHWD